MKKSLFPFFKHNPNVVYLDSAATSHKPKSVIKSITNFYSKDNATILRSTNKYAIKAENLFFNSKEKILKFLNGDKSEYNVVFLDNSTYAFNILSLSKKYNKVLISIHSHNSASMPFITKGKFSIFKSESELISKIKTGEYDAVVFPHISNVDGSIFNIKKIAFECNKYNIDSIVDAAQSIACRQINLEESSPTVLIFSGHKCYGPLGVGLLIYKKEINITPPIVGGGSIDFIDKNYIPKIAGPIEAIESGTKNIPSIDGLSVSLDFIKNIGIDNIEKHNRKLFFLLLNELDKINDINILNREPGSILSFYHKNVSSLDIETALSEKDICIRSGKMCSNIFFQDKNYKSIVRVSFGIYNSVKDIDFFIKELKKFLLFIK